MGSQSRRAKGSGGNGAPSGVPTKLSKARERRVERAAKAKEPKVKQELVMPAEVLEKVKLRHALMEQHQHTYRALEIELLSFLQMTMGVNLAVEPWQLDLAKGILRRMPDPPAPGALPGASPADPVLSAAAQPAITPGDAPADTPADEA